MENQTLILIAVAAVVAYFLFFKKKEGFTQEDDKKLHAHIQKVMPNPHHFLTWAFILLPSRYGRTKEVLRAQEWVKSMITYKPKKGVFSIHPNSVRRFDSYYNALYTVYTKNAQPAGFKFHPK